MLGILRSEALAVLPSWYFQVVATSLIDCFPLDGVGLQSCALGTLVKQAIHFYFINFAPQHATDS
ncbi:uncharacterized protein MYCFIDRAFT_173588 [Pseudocercospora fijiensis CIRAD86]|uniref:Uncharacterized protein n=1 Tax=Pseudocercospora fijiensis (strain CIRAD86) TaxID=383855 RepID=M3A0F5_PSEFD|nr:uncharacterized protein MYCFIDRAFT_173588 [Pseudocercospora fijiensis CIRAD86]EME84639.1 hypothetical protein MYCFIDRAFT_173588 [Pseudocercospora fijiensis CIRAD86]